MFFYGWSVLRLGFGLLMLSFYPLGSFVLSERRPKLLEIVRSFLLHIIINNNNNNNNIINNNNFSNSLVRVAYRVLSWCSQ